MASASESQSSDQAWAELHYLLAQRIRDGLAGRISDKTASEIVEEELATFSG